MSGLADLFERNQAWAAAKVAENPRFFANRLQRQAPEYLWIGCSDSRVPANQVVGLAPGEVFVHRNVANIVRNDDRNCLSVLQYAVDVLKIAHIIVCGHYRCGGVQAALGPSTAEPLEGWLTPIRTVAASHRHDLAQAADDGARWDRLCELNVVEQTRIVTQLPTVTAAWRRGQRLVVHGWIYDLRDGLLRDLGVSVDGQSR